LKSDLKFWKKCAIFALYFSMDALPRYVSAMVGSVIQTNVVIAQIGMMKLGVYVQRFVFSVCLLVCLFVCLGFLVVISECIFFLNFKYIF
jgi:hypothetical protein